MKVQNKIRLSKSSIGELEKQAVLKVMEKEYLGMGEEVKLFEDEIKNYLNTEFEVVCVNTGTSALHLAIGCLGIGQGDEVLVPSLTYVASFQSISATGATPIACEVNPDTLFMDVHDARKRVTERTKAIMPVHYASNSNAMDDVYELAREFNLRVIEDAAQAFGSIRNGHMVGTTGDIICFSFDGIKNITSAEGGAIVSSDLDFIKKAKDARLLGVEKDTEQRYLGQRSWDFDVKEQGFRYHMSNLMAAIGRVQLSRLDEFRDKRQKIASRYIDGLIDIDKIELLRFDFQDVLPHIFVIKAEQRDSLRNFLLDNNIECGIHYKPNHMLTKYKASYSLPVVEDIYGKILTLPCHVDLSVNEQQFVISKIREFYEQ